MKLSLSGRIVLTVLCFGIALVGFMIKLPPVFRGHDTELHSLFYFLAAGFLNVLFVKRNIPGHVLVFVLLYAMGIGIEYAQEYSNSYVGQRIHGRYDPEDVVANLKGLVCFSVVWAAYVIIWYATSSKRSNASATGRQSLPAALADNDVDEVTRQTRADSLQFGELQDRENLRTAIQLLSEVMSRNPGHPLSEHLQATITELKNKIMVK